MVSRKSHPKSRNGCPQCKKRRIKCDEVRPRCSNCMKHDIDCSFQAASPTKSASSSARKRQRSNDSKSARRSSSGQSPLIKDPQAAGDLTGSGGELPPLQFEELELLHHFVTETYKTLSDREESHELWKVVVPRIAFEHDFLMRGVLAISALHLSTLRPSKQNHYTNIAVQQQDAALSSFRTVMTSMDASNCDAFFAMSTLIVVYGFESPKSSDGLGMFEFNEHSDDWLPLIRGVNSILQTVWGDVKRGRLNRLLHDHDQSPVTKHIPQIVDDQFTLLQQLCNNMLRDEDKTACLETTYHLRYVYERMINKTANECEVSLSFLWPVMIPQHYLTLLSHGKSETLIILAHYCTILDRLNEYWWLKGWASHIINHIQIELDDDMQHWIQWPLNIVNLEANIITNGDVDNPIRGMRVSNDLDTKIDDQLAIPDDELKQIRPKENADWAQTISDAKGSMPEKPKSLTSQGLAC